LFRERNGVHQRFNHDRQRESGGATNIYDGVVLEPGWGWCWWSSRYAQNSEQFTTRCVTSVRRVCHEKRMFVEDRRCVVVTAGRWRQCVRRVGKERYGEGREVQVR